MSKTGESLGSLLESLGTDLKLAFRRLKRSPGFTITVLLVLAIGIGINTTIFSVIEGVLLRPLPYGDAERLCVLWKSVPQKGIDWDWTSAPTLRDWQEQTDLFKDVAMVLRPEASRIVLRGDNAAEEVQGSIVSGNFFDILGVRPLLGRTFSTSESAHGEDVAVISYAMWKGRFAGTSTILGKSMELNDRRISVIGVMPPDFQYPNKEAELWTLLTSDPRWPAFQRIRIADAFSGLARLKPGRSIDDARAELNGVAAKLAKENPATDAGLGIRIVSLRDQIADARLRRALWTLGGAALCVLLIACSNIASLLLARNVNRQKEIEIRTALGAGYWQLVRQSGAEGLLLALAGGLGAILLAYASLHSLLALAPADLPRSSGIAIHGMAAAFGFGLSLLTGLILALLPLSAVTRVRNDSHLQGQGRGVSPGKEARRARGLLVAAQFSAAIVLLTSLGLLVRSFLLLDAVHTGFDSSHLLTINVRLPDNKYGEAVRGQAFFDEAVERLDALPGSSGAAAGYAVLPTFQANMPDERIVVEGKPLTQDQTRHGRNIVSDNYFSILGIPLQEGRLFTAGDAGGKPDVAIINRKMAQHFWPSEDAVGKRFKQVLPGTDRAWITVVGVVSDVIYNRDGVSYPLFYSPARQWYSPNRQLIVRTKGDPRIMIDSVRRTLQAIDQTLPPFEVQDVPGQMAAQDRPRSFLTQLIGVFAGIALLLAAIGLYGLMAYSVEQQTKEIGIRLALGANRTTVARMILREGVLWGAAGIAVGAVGSVAFGRMLSASLYQVTATDPVTFFTVIALLACVMLTAIAAPIHRAGKIDPAGALRCE